MTDSLTVSSHLRRLRSASPYVSPSVGPFDWEERLVYSAPDNGALFFGNGLLLCADDVWQTEEAAVLVVSTEDLRALFNACSDGMPLVILPEDWQRDG